MARSLTATLRSVLSRIPRPSSLQDAMFTDGDNGSADGSAPAVVVVDSLAPQGQSGVPDALRVAAGWMWRLLIVGAFAHFLYQALNMLSEVVIPLVIALLLTAVFWPLRDWLVNHRVPHVIAALLCLLLLLAVVAGIISLVTLQIATQWSDLGSEAVSSFNRLLAWLESGRMHLSNAQIDSGLRQLQQKVAASRSHLGSYAATFGSQLTRFFAGLLLTLFSLLYFLFDGRRLANTAAQLIPRGSRDRIMDAATRGWIALVAYVRAAVVIAACDALGALIGAFFIGSTMWLAIGALTFLCAFVPLLGALFSGAVATSVVFVTLGPVKAIIMLAVFIAVLELEGHVMEPFLLGKAVSIHPLLVLFGIATGMVIGGPIGALFTVPLMAFANAFIRGWNRSRERHYGPGSGPMSSGRMKEPRGPGLVAQDSEQINHYHQRQGQAAPDAGVDSVARNDAQASQLDHQSGHGGVDPDDPDLANR